MAGEVYKRFEAFGIPTIELDTSDVLEILTPAGEWLTETRNQQSPRALIIHTCRFGPHSKGDDTRPQEEIDRLMRTRDPVLIHGNRIKEAERQRIEAEVNDEISTAFFHALEDPYPDAKRT